MSDIINSIEPLISRITEKHPLVAKKLSMSADQLDSARSIEEYQQVGILIRDAWIELTQKLYDPSLVPDGMERPGSSDVKRMLECIVNQWKNCPRTLLGLSKALYSLSVEIQHDRSTESVSLEWSLLSTAFAMCLLIDLDSQHEQLANRKYYKCPQCGSMNLKYKKDREVDPIDGPIYEYEVWECDSCDWEHFIMLG